MYFYPFEVWEFETEKSVPKNSRLKSLTDPFRDHWENIEFLLGKSNAKISPQNPIKIKKKPFCGPVYKDKIYLLHLAKMNKNRTRLRVVCFYGGKKYYTTQDIIPKELNTLLHSLVKKQTTFYMRHFL